MAALNFKIDSNNCASKIECAGKIAITLSVSQNLRLPYAKKTFGKGGSISGIGPAIFDSFSKIQG